MTAKAGSRFGARNGSMVRSDGIQETALRGFAAAFGGRLIQHS